MSAASALRALLHLLSASPDGYLHVLAPGNAHEVGRHHRSCCCRFCWAWHAVAHPSCCCGLPVQCDAALELSEALLQAALSDQPATAAQTVLSLLRNPFATRYDNLRASACNAMQMVKDLSRGQLEDYITAFKVGLGWAWLARRALPLMPHFLLCTWHSCNLPVPVHLRRRHRPLQAATTTTSSALLWRLTVTLPCWCCARPSKPAGSPEFSAVAGAMKQAAHAILCALVFCSPCGLHRLRANTRTRSAATSNYPIVQHKARHLQEAGRRQDGTHAVNEQEACAAGHHRSHKHNGRRNVNDKEPDPWKQLSLTALCRDLRF